MMNFVLARNALLIGVTSLGMFGQVPINDSVVVTFPCEVHVGRQVLPAGEYTIRQLNTSSSPRLLEFSTNKGTAIQASATAIAVVDSNNVNDSSVVLETRGGVQYVHRIWIKGKSYGYEFPVSGANDAESASASNSLRLSATYATAAAPRAPDTTAAVTPSTNDGAAATPSPNPTVAEKQPEAVNAQPSGLAQQAQQQPQQQPEQNQPSQQPEAQQPQQSQQSEQAQPQRPEQSQQPEQAQQSPQAQQSQRGGRPQTDPSVTSAPQQSGTPVPSSTPAMPDTTLNWMGLVAAGAGLIASGLFLRAGRRRA